jgi:hypothetical protein
MTTASVRTAPTHRTRRPSGRRRLSAYGLLTSALVLGIVAGVAPASAALEEGTPPAPVDCRVVWGWPNGADGPAYPGQRFGIDLPPQCRGPVLEGLDP